jgi:hypothetical protein
MGVHSWLSVLPASFDVSAHLIACSFLSTKVWRTKLDQGAYEADTQKATHVYANMEEAWSVHVM